MIKHILIAEDEPLMRSFLNETLKRKGYAIDLAEDGEQAVSLLKQKNYDLLVTDMKMPHKNGLKVLEEAKALYPNILVIVMTAYGSVENAVEAMKLGAFHYLIKPFSPEAIETLVAKAEEQTTLLSENRYLKTLKKTPLIASSLSMKALVESLPRIAKSNASVFISGESGTGKEVIASVIHELSERNPFIKVNCAALPESLLESELFGHERGAFTGANMKKEGRFELANKGTLLLDEITEIPLSLQPKLLRAIQEQEFERVGGTHPIKVDIRFIATSNRNLKDVIEKQLFREDLFYRLNVVPIAIPALRERKEDILPLAEYFLENFSLENHKKKKSFSPKAIELLISYSWPGNIRQLANVIERAIVMDYSDIIESSHLFLEGEKEEVIPVGTSLQDWEKKLILATLKEHRYNRTKTAKTLKINIRTLRNKLKLYEGSFTQSRLF